MAAEELVALEDAALGAAREARLAAARWSEALAEAGAGDLSEVAGRAADAVQDALEALTEVAFDARRTGLLG